MNSMPAPGHGFARGSCLFSLLVLLALQWIWPGRLQPDWATSGVVIASFMSLPLAALALGLWRKWPRARFWSGVAALFYFCHGIAEAWAIPASWLPGMAEALLSVVVVVASSWDGLRARLGAKARSTV